MGLFHSSISFHTFLDKKHLPVLFLENDKSKFEALGDAVEKN